MPEIRRQLAASDASVVRGAGLSRGSAKRLPPVARIPRITWAVIGSRLSVLIFGAAGVGLSGRVSGWQAFDPTRLSASFGLVGNALTATSVRWDSLHYLDIAEHGYKSAGDTAFFPFYPLLIHALAWITVSHVIAGLLISAIAFAVGLVMLHRLTCELIGERTADATLLLIAFAPLSFFFTAIYTESVFLALSVGTFYLASRDRFGLACTAAACAALTHVEGITLIAPLVFIYWERRGRPLTLRPLLSWEAAPLVLPLIAVTGLGFYMHEIGYSWLAPIIGAGHIGPGHLIASPKSVFGRAIVAPPVTIWRAVTAGVSGLWQTTHGTVAIVPGLGDVFSVGFQNLVYLVVLVISLLALVGAWRILPPAYAIYATCVILLFTASVVTIIPLRAFDRYMLPIFPLWMSAAKWLEQRRLMPHVVSVSAVLLAFYAVEFARWASVA